MQPQILDPTVHSTCRNCTACCDQPWRTMIEPDKAAALDEVDWSGYPQLAGKTLYYRDAGDGSGLYRLAKGEGTRCLFLDEDGLCIIHKELGAEAKPTMCRQFPLLSVQTWVDDRVSVNFGCPSVQQDSGATLEAQATDIAAFVPRTQRDARPDATVPLDGTTRLTSAENEAFVGRAAALFDASTEGDVWTRFSKLLALLVAMRQNKQAGTDLAEALRSGGPLPHTPEMPEARAFPAADRSPMPVRFLFAATLFPDTVPPDAVTAMGFFKRLTQVPKLMSLATMKGGYASRILGRNVSIDEVMGHALVDELDPGATRLLMRYYRSRLWQQYIGGTRLAIMAGVHQHIQDFNAILFFARAIAQEQGATHLSEAIVRRALTGVEFHLANQTRLFEKTLKGWIRGQLASPELAFASLRLMSLKASEAVAAAGI